MPYSEKQRRFMYAEIARKEAGKRTRTGMTLGQLMDYAHAPLEKKKAKASK
jgi:hypothetical protein